MKHSAVRKVEIKVAKRTKSIRQLELDKAVEAFRQIRSQIALLENQLKVPRAVLQKAAERSSTGEIIGDGYKISYTDCEREVFDLKSAKVVLGNKLNPFLSVTSYKQLRIV